MIVCTLRFNPPGLPPKEVNAYLDLEVTPRVGEEIELFFGWDPDTLDRHVWTVYKVRHLQISQNKFCYIVITKPIDVSKEGMNRS